jgi:hypothetical protein
MIIRLAIHNAAGIANQELGSIIITILKDQMKESPMINIGIVGVGFMGMKVVRILAKTAK